MAVQWLGGSDSSSIWGIHIPQTYSPFNGEPAKELRLEFPDHQIDDERVELIDRQAGRWGYGAYRYNYLKL